MTMRPRCCLVTGPAQNGPQLQVLHVQEMTQTATMVKALDQEIEQIVPVVLKKAGEMSQAGRETFLAAEASGLLTAMADCLSVARVRSWPC